MQARYPTRCGACSGPIAAGEDIVRAADGATWVHTTCPESLPGMVLERPDAAVATHVPAGATLRDAFSLGSSGTTEVFTDGACRGNPGPGGWAWAVQDGPQGSGHDPATTNQRMEVRAAYEAILVLPGPLVVVSDSTYVVNCFKNSWWTGWRARGWVNSARKPVANRDLWEPLIDLVEARADVSFRWVKGHSGHAMNDLVDRLAVEASHES